jgi:hypothetical protein
MTPDIASIFTIEELHGRRRDLQAAIEALRAKVKAREAAWREND